MQADNDCYTKCDIKENKAIVKENDIEPHLRDTLTKSMPPSQINGGLFSGPPVDYPWMPIPITPTETNYIVNNLKSANPPPGALEQFISVNRPGNNYSAKPNILKFNNTNTSNCGPFNIIGPK